MHNYKTAQIFTSYMCQLKEEYEIDRRILRCDYTRYSSSIIPTIKTPNFPKNIIINREDSVNSMADSYLELNFDIIKSGNSSNADGTAIRIFDLGPIALCSIYKLTTSSRKHLADNNHAHIVSLKYKIITSSRDSDGLSIGFDRD